MNALWFVVGIALLAAAAAVTLSDEESQEWESFKGKYNKAYDSEEEDVRMNIYFDNKAKIAAHNEKYANGEVSFTVGVNSFADMLPHEVAARFNGYKSDPSRRSTSDDETDVEKHKKLRKSVDWRKSGIVTPVKNQEQCGGCWAFSSTGSIEGQHAKKTGKLVSLSEQNLIDCSSDYGNLGCDGGIMDYAFEYVIANKGIDTEASYPFVTTDGQNETCRFNRSDVGATISSYKNVKSGSEKALERAVATIGPVSVAIDASLWSFQLYSGGIYDEPNCSSTELDHGVLAVGYGVDKNKKYWLVKNSWGTDWGLKGYIKMSKDKKNQCGIATEASYPIV